MVVRMRSTRAHTKNRRGHHKLEKPRFSVAETGAIHPRHRALLDGTPYRGKSVMDRTRRKTLHKKQETAKDFKKKNDKKREEAPA